jgi:S1-C subfamily serine protease
MKVDNITPELASGIRHQRKSGVVVVSVEQGSLADEGSIQQGDILMEVNRKTVRNMADSHETLSLIGNGQPILLRLKRREQTFFATLES